jgi:hypothetical protein
VPNSIEVGCVVGTEQGKTAELNTKLSKISASKYPVAPAVMVVLSILSNTRVHTKFEKE